jgi:hypothetical protein
MRVIAQIAIVVLFLGFMGGLMSSGGPNISGLNISGATGAVSGAAGLISDAAKLVSPSAAPDPAPAVSVTPSAATDWKPGKHAVSWTVAGDGVIGLVLTRYSAPNRHVKAGADGCPDPVGNFAAYTIGKSWQVAGKTSLALAMVKADVCDVFVLTATASDGRTAQAQTGALSTR